MQPKLVVVDGPAKGQSFQLSQQNFTIGRQDGSDLQILDAAVSRQHCEIRPRDADSGGGWELVDAGSSHGTRVHGVPVDRHRLVHGDFLQFGGTVLLFLDEAETQRDEGDHDVLVARSTAERTPQQIADMLHGSPRSSSEELALLLRIAAEVQEQRNVRSLAERMLALLGTALEAERGALIGLDAESRRPSVIASWGRNGDGRLVPSRTLVDRIVDERVAVLWADVDRDASLAGADSIDRALVRSLVAAPLSGRRDLHGILYFESPLRFAFSELHLELTATAAALAGLAFDNARAFDDLNLENQRLRLAGSEHGLIGDSAEMERLLDFISRVAAVDSTVLLRGESGTGKELVARSLHRASPRSGGPFIAINCATLSDTLLESELFGHERGSFTGAVARKVGKLEAADGGSLFLDEVGEMPAAIQARLLRVLQERSFERVGGTQPIDVDVRVIAATNRDLEEAIREGEFREDLFYRLNVIAYELPPLRERRQDIPLLARHFVARHGERLQRPGVGLDATALQALMAYDWPGNIRQLSNALERALVLGDGELIRPEDLPDEVLDQSAEVVALGDYQEAITETKKRLLTTALAEADGNAAEAGRRLGLHPNSFRRLMRQLGLRSDDD